MFHHRSIFTTVENYFPGRLPVQAYVVCQEDEEDEYKKYKEESEDEVKAEEQVEDGEDANDGAEGDVDDQGQVRDAYRTLSSGRLNIPLFHLFRHLSRSLWQCLAPAYRVGSDDGDRRIVGHICLNLILVPLHLVEICKGDVQKTLPPCFGFERDPALKNLYRGFWSPQGFCYEDKFCGLLDHHMRLQSFFDLGNFVQMAQLVLVGCGCRPRSRHSHPCVGTRPRSGGTSNCL